MLEGFSSWIVSISGTEQGQTVALIFAILAAAFHAAFGALQKGRHDPWVSRAAIDVGFMIWAWPAALFLVPSPGMEHIWLFVGVFLIHNVYKVLQGMTYARGAYTVVYPVVRGTGPLVTVVIAGFVFSESFNAWQWAGVAALSLGIFGLGAYNYRKLTVGRETLIPALGLAVLTGIAVAAYTTYDAYGIRLLPDPLTFIVWFFAIDSLTIPVLVGAWVVRGKIQMPVLGPLVARGVTGGILGPLSFGCIMLATRLDKVGEAAVLRETSVLFAAAIGVVFLKETVGPRRIALMALIALGAVLVEAGG